MFEFTFFFILFLLSELNETSEDGARNDECEVEVEPVIEFEVACLDLVNDSELVGVATSVEGDTAEEEVRSSE